MIERESQDNNQQLSRWRYTTAKKKPNARQDESTAVKKDPYSDERRMNKMSRMIDKKAQLQQIYQDFMEQSQYTKAEQAKAAIKYLTNQKKQKRARMLSQSHSIQRQELKTYHKREMQRFKKKWSQIYMQQSMEERIMVQKLAQMRKIDQQESKMRIARRCQSAKPTVQIAKLNQLVDCERSLRKRGKTVQLRKVRDEKKRLIEQCKRQHKRMVDRIAQHQQRRIAEKQTRRYRSFMHRVEQTRRDNQRLHRREEHRLKQKYKNVLRKLEHEQKKDFNEWQRKGVI